MKSFAVFVVLVSLFSNGRAEPPSQYQQQQQYGPPQQQQGNFGGGLAPQQQQQQSYGPPQQQQSNNIGQQQPQAQRQSYAAPQQQSSGQNSQQSFSPSPQQNYGAPVHIPETFSFISSSASGQQQPQVNQQQYSQAQQQSYGVPAQTPSQSSPPPQPQQNYAAVAPQQQQQQPKQQSQRYGPPGYKPSDPIGPESLGGNAEQCPPNDPSRNKELVLKAYQELFGDHNLQNVDQYFAQEYIQHNPLAADGIEALKALIRMAPDPPQQIQFMRHIAQDDLVWTHARINFFGTNYAAVDIFRIECGKIKEHWDVLQDTNLKMPSMNSHPFF